MMPAAPSPDWLSWAWAFWAKDPESVRNLFVILGGLIGLGLLGWRTLNIHRQTKTLMRRHEAQVEADRERRITDNFTRAVEQLGSERLETRLGAIYALERIARESERDHWPIMETLTAYVRERLWAAWDAERARQQEDERVLRSVKGVESEGEVKGVESEWDRREVWREGLAKTLTDIQAALTVIGRRRVEYDAEGRSLQLQRTDRAEQTYSLPTWNARTWREPVWTGRSWRKLVWQARAWRELTWRAPT